MSNKKVSCTLKSSHFNCQACHLRKSCLSLELKSHQTSTLFELIFNDVWGSFPMFFSNGFCYFVIFVDAHTKYIWFFSLVAKKISNSY